MRYSRGRSQSQVQFRYLPCLLCPWRGGRYEHVILAYEEGLSEMGWGFMDGAQEQP